MVLFLFQFFVQNSKEDDAYDIEYPDFDIEEVGKTVRLLIYDIISIHITLLCMPIATLVLHLSC